MLHKLKFRPSVLLLTIKMSQSAREKLDSYCKIPLLQYYKVIYNFPENRDTPCGTSLLRTKAICSKRIRGLVNIRVDFI